MMLSFVVLKDFCMISGCALNDLLHLRWVNTKVMILVRGMLLVSVPPQGKLIPLIFPSFVLCRYCYLIIIVGFSSSVGIYVACASFVARGLGGGGPSRDKLGMGLVDPPATVPRATVRVEQN